MCDNPDPLFGDYAQDGDKNENEFQRTAARSNPVMRRGAGVDLNIIKEIVASNPSQKSWKGIVIAIFVIAFISGIILLAIYLTSPDLFHGSTKTDFGEKFSFKDFFIGRNIQKSLVFQFLGDDTLSYLNESMDSKLLNMKTMQEEDTILRTYLEEKKASTASIAISEDKQFLMISYNLNANYRHSAIAEYTVFNLKNPQQHMDVGSQANSALQNAVWSPKTHILTYAHNNHLYYKENPLDKNGTICVTENIHPVGNYITYGVADWLYEEEILKVSKAFWWSEEETALAFISFNDENVQNYKLKVYGDRYDINGDFINVKYPKAGKVPRAKNPEIEIYVYDRSTKQPYKLPKPMELPKDHYVCMVKWIGEKHLLIGWLNREQNHTWISLVTNFAKKPQPDTWVIYEESVENGWINMLKQRTNEPLISPDKSTLYFLFDRITKGTRYSNIAELTMTYRSGRRAKKRWIAPANFDFHTLLHLDKDTIYFSAPLKNDPKVMHLYKANVIDNQFTCITCKEANCSYFGHKFNKNGKYVIQSCMGPSVPTYTLLQRLPNGEFKVKTILMNNTELTQMISTRAMPIIEYHKVKIPINKTNSLELEAKLWLPVNLNKAHVTQYPLLLHVYGGPSSQTVTTKFSISWNMYIVSSLNVIVLQVDGRGTKLRGRAFEWAVYKNLGNIEIHDQLMAVREISNLKYINKSQVGAFGWSYGGFSVGHLLGHSDNHLIRCGVSVAPVSSFDYYDSAYTERYLGIKENDITGAYQQTDITAKAKNFANKEFLLIHGTKDDNVHFMNTAKLIRALVANDISFDVMVYPDEAHTLMGGRTHIHVYRKITSFLMNCYNRTSIEYKYKLYE